MKSEIGPLADKEGNYVADPKAMADVLSRQYASVFSTARNATPTQNTLNPCIDNLIFNEEDIIAAIDELKPNSSAGPDGFPAILIKNC